MPIWMNVLNLMSKFRPTKVLLTSSGSNRVYNDSLDKVRKNTYTVENIWSSRSCRQYFCNMSVPQSDYSLRQYEIQTSNLIIHSLDRYQSQGHAKDVQQLISLTKMKGSSHSDGVMDVELPLP